MQTVVKQPGATRLVGSSSTAFPPTQHLYSQHGPYTYAGAHVGFSGPTTIQPLPAHHHQMDPSVYYYDDPELLYGPPQTICDWLLERFCCCCLATDSELGGSTAGRSVDVDPTGKGSPRKMPWGSQRRRGGKLFLLQNMEYFPKILDDELMSLADRPEQKLSREVYQKIKEVDNQSSTLTAAGVQGLSARVLDKFEYREYLPDGSPETFVCQTIELFKRPGQSLGLFLREGNGVDRYDGVFVSRFGEESELAKFGDVVRPGDEILTVNNVEVSNMGIDEVVVIMSIPRRLILRLRFVKSRRDGGMAYADSQATTTKPVVVVKHPSEIEPKDFDGLSREGSQESGLADSAPTPTARTSLGLKARQQMQEIQQQRKAGQNSIVKNHDGEQGPTERTRLLQQDLIMSLPSSSNYPVGIVNPYYSTASTSGTPIRRPVPYGVPRRSNSDRWSHGAPARQQYAMHQPRLLDSQGQPLSTAEQYSPLDLKDTETVSTTARVPPPRLVGIQPVVQRVESFRGQPRPGSGMFSPQSVLSDSVADYQRTFHDAPALHSAMPPEGLPPFRGPPPPLPPKPALRQPSAFPLSSVGVGDMKEQYYQLGKSNSLPRRRQTGRSVKWRNDVRGGGVIPTSIAAVPPGDLSTDSDGAISAPEFGFSPTGYPLPRPPYAASMVQRPMIPPRARIRDGLTVDDIFSAQEYRAWAGRGRPPPGYTADGRLYGRVPPISESFTAGAKFRSSSLPPRGILAELAQAPPGQRFSIPPATMVNGGTPYGDTGPLYANLSYPSAGGIPIDKATISRLDVSPLLGRRALQTVGSTWSADPDEEVTNLTKTGAEIRNQQILTSLTGLLIVHILEGRGLRIPERQKEWTDEMYCVLELDGEHRARTGVSTWEQRFRWDETFEIDTYEGRQLDLYVYSWHPQFRHKLCHRGSLKLLEAFVIDRLNGEKRFALNLEPRGQLLVRVSFLGLPVVFRRPIALRRTAYFGIDLVTLIERERDNTGFDVPVVLKRLIDEIERRGVDSPGIYLLCGAAEKKRELRHQLERSPLTGDVSADAMPDTNVLTAVLKDFLRELPEPLVPGCIYQMLVDGWRVRMPNDREGSARLMLGVVDCMPRMQKCTLMVLMDHLKCVSAQAPHNGVSSGKLSAIFGPLLFCTAHPRLSVPPDVAANAAAAGLPPPPADVDRKRISMNFLDHKLVADVLEFLLNIWPGRTSSSESSGSENSTINMTNNGALPLLNIWLQENRLPESNC